MINNQLIFKAIRAAFNAGEAIMVVYNDEISVSYKDDTSPLTEADTRANNEISSVLGDEYPILSEEGKAISYAERKEWPLFWLVDPLDGTKEFIKKNGEFTVNIALIKAGMPVLGVVYIPATRKMYIGSEGLGSFSYQVSDAGIPGDLEAILGSSTKLNDKKANGNYVVVASRSHMSPETESFIAKKKEEYGTVELISSGSSIKLCLVAEGKAHVYPRLAPTMEWDTAAAHAVARFADCRVYDYESNQELTYNKENLLNPWFVVERHNQN